MSASILKPFVLLMTLIIVAPVSAQQIHSYKMVPRTIYEKKPVKVTKWVDETVMEKQTVTSYKKVWHTETRERYKTEYKPVRKTSEREERTVVRKPFVETRYRKKETSSTTYETVTEMRDESYTVRQPIIETEMREETVTVRKPVTEQLIEVQRTTTFKPVLKNTTNYVPGNTFVEQLNVVDAPNQRPRMQMLPAGNYTDAVTGLTVYRRRGLHWVQPSTVVPIASTVPTLVPQEANEWSFEPETTETRKPVEVTRFVEQTETRRVPVEVQRTIDRVETRKVPVTVRIPKTTVVVEEVPYTETVFKDEVIVKKVPYTETTFEKVETVEAYTVEVPQWIPETKEVEVPRTVRKRVEYEVMQDIPRTVLYRIPLDDCGNEIGPAVVVDSETQSNSSVSNQFSSAEGTTTSQRVPTTEFESATDTGKSVLKTEADSDAETGVDSEGESNGGYQGELNLVEPKTLQETSSKEPNVDVPDTTAGDSTTKLGDIPGRSTAEGEAGAGKLTADIAPAIKPEEEQSASGNENATDRPPVPRDPEIDAPAGEPNVENKTPESGDAESGESEVDDAESDDAETGNVKNKVA